MKKPVIALVAGVLLAGGIAAYLWLELRAAREQGGALAARMNVLESAQRETASVPQSSESRPPESAAPSAAAPPQIAAAPVAPSSPPQATAVQQAAAKVPATAVPAAMQSSRSEDPARAMVRGMMMQIYPDVARELGLTAAETDKLFDLISGGDGNLTADTMNLMSGKHTPDEQRELQRKLLEDERVQEEKVVALLGSRYPKWQEYQATAAARQQVTALRSTLSLSGNPLNKSQEEALVTAFAANQARNLKEQRDSLNSPAVLNSQNPLQASMQTALKSQRDMLDAATPHLDAAQLAQFRRQVEQQEQMLSATMGMMGGQRDAAAPSTPPRAP